MGLALDEGLASGFGLLGQSILQDQRDARREAMEERKLQMQNTLAKDLMQAKFQFMKDNPTYKGHATDLEGNIIAFDMFGNPKVVYQASPEQKAIRLKQAQANADKAAAQTASDTASAADKTQHAAYLADKMKNPNKYKPNTQGQLVQDPYQITPEQLNDLAVKRMPKNLVEFAGPGDADYDAAHKKAISDIVGEGYQMIKPGTAGKIPKTSSPSSPSGAGVFQSLVPGSTTAGPDTSTVQGGGGDMSPGGEVGGGDEDPDADGNDDEGGLLNPYNGGDDDN